MITTLHIKNIGIIDDLTIELDKGFNVLTGETGAGKTLIIDSINIISGGRFSKEIIRRGEEYSFVEVNLFLETNDEFTDGNVVVSREVHLNGRNICKINGRLVTVTELREFMSNIIDIHGQNDNLKILSKMYQIGYLDNYCGNDLLKLKLEYSENYSKYLNIKKKLKENFGDNKERERKLDLLQYEFDEIDVANLKVGEEKELIEERMIYLNYEKISTSISQSIDFSSKALSNLESVIKSLEKIADLDDEYSKKLENVRNIYYELDDFSHDVNFMSDEIFFNEVTYKGNTLYNGVDYHLMKDKIFGKRSFKKLKEFLNINNNELDLKKKLIDETDFKKFKVFTENLLARNPIDEEIEYTIKAFYDFETEFSNFLYHLIQLNDRIIEYHLPEYKTQQDLIMKSINELEEDKTSWIMFKIFFDFLFLVNIILHNQEYYMSPIDIKKINPYGFEKDDKAMVNYINKKIIEGKIEENNAKYGNVYYILERIRNAIMHGNIKILLENNNILLKFLDKYNSREDVLSIELNKLKNFIFLNDWSYDK